MNGDSRPAAKDVLEHLQSRRDDLVGWLRCMTEAESPSDVPGAQHEIREIIAAGLERLDYRVKRIPGHRSGGMLHARPARRQPGQPAQLLLGHYDTVWPLGTLDDMPFELEGDVVRGPGVYDMKGGIAQALLAIEAIEHFNVEPEVTPHIFLNSDEEIGSRESRRYIESLAPHMDRVFVLEPSLGPAGRLKTARKGIGRYTVTVQGEAAHAGLDPGAGASAILELSHVIQALFTLNDFDKGITVNVGTIDGGLRPNVVAPRSEAVVDVRVATKADASRIEAAILGLVLAVRPWKKHRPTGSSGRWLAAWVVNWEWNWKKVWRVEVRTETSPVSIPRRWMAWARWVMARTHATSTSGLGEPHNTPLCSCSC
jgi:glutamate carboxypeptidase